MQFYFNYVKNIQRETEELRNKKRNSKLGSSEALTPMQETRGQVWVMKRKS
jgi:hypothetical protein